MKKILVTLWLVILISCTSHFFSKVIAASIADDLTKLNNLYKEGAITKEEFSKAKSVLFKSESTESKTETKKNKTKKKEKKKIEKKKAKETKKSEGTKNVSKIETFDESLNKTFMTLEEVEALGTYKKIEKIPDGMFEISMSSKARAKESMMKMYDVFVRNKGLMEKYPERLMRAMGYFELFYMDQLDEKRDEIKRFKKNYPNISKGLKKKMQSLYSLNQARKSMREAMGLTLNDDPEVALDRYMAMHNFLEQGEKSINKLTKDERRLKKKSANFKKKYGSFKKNIELRSENRIDQKTFDKELKKNIKDVKKALGKLTDSGSKGEELYTAVATMFEKSLEILDNCSVNCARKDLLAVVDSTVFTNTIIADVEKTLIPKKHIQDMSKVDMENIPDNTKAILASVSTGMKEKKAIKNNDLQNSVLNLENNNFPVGEYLDNFEKQGFDIKSVTMSFGNIDEMNGWEVKDWANSWRGELPSDIKDKSGNLIEFTEENIQDLKAQLALNTFDSMIDTSTLEIKESMNENVREIVQAIEASGGFDLDAWKNQDFSITLDNYIRLSTESIISELGDSITASAVNLIRENANFENFTALKNLEWGSNMSPEEYASYWESAAVEDSTSNWGDITKGVELIDQVGSFEAASIAASIGHDLQTVADSIALAASVGVSSDLEAAAAGLGYDSFADAVAAYNAQYGTNYTEAEARENLGQ